MNIISRKEAKQQGLKQYFTGKPCKNGHISPKSTTSANCLACWRDSSKVSREQNPEHHKELRKADYERNRDSILAQQKAYRDANWDKIYERRKSSSEYKEYMRLYMRAYHKRAIPQAKMLAYSRFRQLTKRMQTPSWAKTKEHQQAIASLYIRARQLTEETGIKHEVDHKVPLKGELVCGLHCLDNLQILTKTENRSKYNYYPV